ncbi:MAG TPA: hypothetical protein PKE55_13505 [Kiritimatiellia bacterium]|nr:hypothetical protein [Kiritimatiellia bacterium]
MRPFRRERMASAGMTLTEVLIGLFLTVVVVSLGGAAYLAVTRALEGQGAREAGVYGRFEAVDGLRADLLGVFVDSGEDSGCDFRLESGGGGDWVWRLSFCTLQRRVEEQDTRWATLSSVRYDGERLADGGMRVIRVEGGTGVTAEPVAVVTSVVVRAVAEVEVALRRGEEWVMAWPVDAEDEGKAPGAVRLRIDPKEEGAEPVEVELLIPAGWVVSSPGG